MVNRKRTREDILEAMLGSVHQKGLNSIGLTELLKVSGASSGSFYHYFASKDELGHALIDFDWHRLKNTLIDPATDHSDDPIAQILWMIDVLEGKHLQSNGCFGCFLGNLVVDLAEYNPSFREHLIAVFDQWQQAFASRLTLGKSQLKAEVVPETLAEEMLTVIQGVLLLGRLYQQPNRLKAGFNQVRQLFYSALQQPPV
ncbi:MULTISPECIES: TetR/AcrR family transcriptional regulator [unclassified Leptolyngbya]|uniref:TetR/AcrR family transcriptional regulator n=1 Tax=unclassified Leptolyngbya TaxID=2650499 RepID=UPI001684E292|nr:MULTISPECIES: TetR/AcrR family transcriptional regulator [unclassified Leptolyngbya]MBD1910014.1 TetR/AcrR family transcriptional regulator [Leptolyngbya sp. FACHB-8]MBD2156836.1 TetR/AcrR family transcriptional regulator [Leptolyngbya sp. FACHB-16]